MAAPFRIERKGVGVREVSAAPGPGPDMESYFERLIKMIPGEVIALYVLGSGVIPTGQPISLVVWAVVCIFAVIAVRAWGSADRSKGETADWMMVLISAVAFVVWLYNLGGPFAAYNLYVPYIGTLVALAYTFFVPIFYRGRVPQV